VSDRDEGGGAEDGDWAVDSVSCPYCGEPVELALEADVDGEMVWDCEVCCRPWRLTVRGAGDDRRLEVRTLDD
jgi:hypothetical protein